MAVAYQMPIRLELAQKIGPRMFRKTILRPGPISKNGVHVDVDRPYMEGLVANFNAGLRETVTLQLADEKNRHNEDPTRTRGRLVGLELTGTDELVGIFEASDEGAALLEKYPYIGCSPAIALSFRRADGREGGPTLLHVAATTDPEIASLGDWVALSAEIDQVIDLTAPPEAPLNPASPQSGPQDAAAPGGDQPEGDPVASLTDEQVAKLLKLIEGDGGSGPAAEDKDDGPDAEFTDAELQAMATPADPPKPKAKPEAKPETPAAEAPADERDPELVAASHEHDEQLELANARIDAQQVELAAMRRERDDERYASEKDRLIRDFSIPADVVELAKPLLHGTGNTLELSAGQKIDGGQVMRKVLHELGRRFKALDLGAEYGTADGQDDAAARQTDLDDFVKRARAELGH